MRSQTSRQKTTYVLVAMLRLLPMMESVCTNHGAFGTVVLLGHILFTYRRLGTVYRAPWWGSSAFPRNTIHPGHERHCGPQFGTAKLPRAHLVTVLYNIRAIYFVWMFHEIYIRLKAPRTSVILKLPVQKLRKLLDKCNISDNTPIEVMIVNMDVTERSLSTDIGSLEYAWV